MLKGISWNNYLLVVVLLTIIWYVFVGLTYYYVDLKELLSGRRKFRFNWFEKNFDSNYDQQSDNLENNPEIDFEALGVIPVNEYTEVDALIAKLKKSVADAVQKKSSKMELETQLRVILNAYSDVGDSGFRDAVNELIISECETVASFTFTQQEADTLWN